MSDVVGNPEDQFSQAAHIYEEFIIQQLQIIKTCIVLMCIVKYLLNIKILFFEMLLCCLTAQ